MKRKNKGIRAWPIHFHDTVKDKETKHSKKQKKHKKKETNSNIFSLCLLSSTLKCIANIFGHSEKEYFLSFDR